MDLFVTLKIAFAAIFALAGTLFLAIGFRSGKQSFNLLRNGNQSSGTVVEMYRKPHRGIEAKSMAEAPVLLFKTASGEARKYYSTVFTTLNCYQIGQQVTIYYLPEDPNIATLEGKDSWILSVAFGIFGIALTAITYPIVIGALLRFVRDQLFKSEV